MKPVCVEDYRRLAARRLPQLLADYVEGGALTEGALNRNVSDFQAVALRQRVLHGVEKVSLATEVLGEPLSLPVLLGPVGLGGMTRRRGEVKAVRAAHAAGTVACLSNVALCGLPEIAAAAPGPMWFQLYLLRDRGYVQVLLQRAWDLGCRVLALTVDVPVTGERLREHRRGLAGGLGLSGEIDRVLDGLSHPAWLWDVYLAGRPHRFGNLPEAQSGSFTEFWSWFREALDPVITPDDLAWLRKVWPGKLIIKGVLDPDDARLAVEAGADGVIVSNHGGRQLDSALSAVRALPRVVEAVDGRAAVLMDGGVRSGEDVVRAMALGAQACLIGRPWIWALAARGEAGVAHVLELFRKQIATTLVLGGCDDVTKVGPWMLA